MEWLILSLLTALSAASQDAWVKKFFSHLNVYEMAVLPMIFSLPMLLTAILFVDIPVLDSTFAVCFIISLPLNALCLVCYMKAIKVSPLSLTLPYLAFSPVFMILTGFLFLGENPEISGIAGVIIICFGAYILNIGEDFRSFFSPVKAILKEQGSRLMLLVALIFSILAPIGKKAILHSSPAFFSYSFFIVLTFFLTGCFYKKLDFNNLFQYKIKGCTAGIFLFFHIIFHGFAVSMINVTYMISIKRFSIIFGIIYGRLFFDEKNTGMRILGALIMISGALLITLFH